MAERPVALIAAVPPLVAGVSAYNSALAHDLRQRGPFLLGSWSRLYPPLLHRREARDEISRPARVDEPDFLLDWASPLTWRAAARRLHEERPRALILPWLHPVMTPPYSYLLRHAPKETQRVVICHNVALHDAMPFEGALTRRVLSQADLLITHAAHQRAELCALGLGDMPLLESFLPLLSAQDLCALPSAGAIAAERGRQGHPGLSLLSFGAVRPYKGLDLGLEALALADPALRARLIIAGLFWRGTEELSALARKLGVEDRVELRDGYQTNETAALLFSCADAALLPYRSASQSGVVGLSFAYGCPVIATSVGGLPQAVRDGRDGLLCPPGDARALAQAMERMAVEGRTLSAGAKEAQEIHSTRRYVDEMLDALRELEEDHPGVPARRPS
jgi:glycosyltransferase involved in cell wall biosynthesis